MQLFGSNTPAILQYLLVFVIILGVLAVLVAILRRITGNNNRVRPGYASSSARHRQQRLGVVDAVDIDAQRQLLLLRRDNVEHLVLIGGPNDLLVESGIGRLPYRLSPHAQQAEPGDEAAGHSAGHEPPVDSPALEDVETVGESARAALDPAPASGSTPPRATLSPPPPARSLATPVAAPVASRPASAARPASASPEEPRPFPPVASATVEGAGDTLFAAPPSRKDEPQPARAPAKGPFSAVARQLDEALKRPFAAVRPSPVTGIDLENGTSALPEAGPVPTAPVPPPASPAAAAPPQFVPSKAPGTAAASGLPAAESSDQPVVVPSPLSAPWFPTRDIARPADDRSDSRDAGAAAATARALSATSPISTPPVAAPPASIPLTTSVAAADRRAPASSTVADAPAVIVPTAGPAVPSTPFAAPVASVTTPEIAVPEREKTAPVSTPPQASAKGPEQEKAVSVEAVDAGDTLRVPDALKGSAYGAGDRAENKSAFDLSSLENIEAEFARLLGRARPADKDK